MAQVDGRADVVVDLQVAWHKGEGAHVVARPPGGSIRLRAVDGVFVDLFQSELEGFQVSGRVVGQLDVGQGRCEIIDFAGGLAISAGLVVDVVVVVVSGGGGGRRRRSSRSGISIRSSR